MNLKDLNHCEAKQARIELLKSCGSQQWTEKMLAARPFSSVAQLSTLAEQFWLSLSKEDYLEAFAAHPKIGDSKPPDKSKNTEIWTSNEQSGMLSADEQTKLDLITDNQKYEKIFGYIFIVCATGKSAAEMLKFLRFRLKNAPDEELKIAAAEQMKITKLRLNKMLDNN
ncbi:MAG: 2-oxo-4-hydroxy-4-carboxy-5-ureidoimidazoline decarboxylase [SAR324 cluster bacterium]|nr:2-oxo-4-hydroxy-4-carboxy-5-ureidoimidazoline decarboxylase [SAR324 cluster bacterium]MBL7034396.1 2-oxo-4-hydroxy-4-carboxy-5-ureidoimidazoline decarboxylase [SAR324 cluster bacterium]